MQLTTIPPEVKQRFIIADGYYIEPQHVDHKRSTASTVVLKDGRQFSR